jgi:hypothetical protein
MKATLFYFLVELPETGLALTQRLQLHEMNRNHPNHPIHPMPPYSKKKGVFSIKYRALGGIGWSRGKAEP